MDNFYSFTFTPSHELLDLYLSILSNTFHFYTKVEIDYITASYKSCPTKSCRCTYNLCENLFGLLQNLSCRNQKGFLNHTVPQNPVTTIHGELCENLHGFLQNFSLPESKKFDTVTQNYVTVPGNCVREFTWILDSHTAP